MDKEYYSYSVLEHGKKKLRRIPYNKELCGLSFSLSEGANSFYYYQDSIYTYFPFNDTIYCVDKETGELLSINYPHELIGLAKYHAEKSPVLKEIVGSISEEGNPILVFYNLRERAE